MRLRTLAAEIAVLDILLGVVPGTAASGHGNRHEQSGDDGAHQYPTQRLGTGFGTEQRGHAEGDHDRRQHRQ